MAKHEASTEPVAYAVYGIQPNGHYVAAVKPIQDEWQIDDHGLGDYWGGNEALYKVSPARTEPQTTPNEDWVKRNDQAWLIVHDLVEIAREDIRLKVKDAPVELVNAINMALYTIRSRSPAPTTARCQAGSAPTRETIAETIWRAEYRRAASKERSVPWSEVAPNDQVKYLFVADAILALSRPKRG